MLERGRSSRSQPMPQRPSMSAATPTSRTSRQVSPGERPHYTVRLRRADDREREELLAALGAARPNPQYGRSSIWREEGLDVPGRHHC
jgi:hypothetical protein